MFKEAILHFFEEHFADLPQLIPDFCLIVELYVTATLTKGHLMESDYPRNQFSNIRSDTVLIDCCKKNTANHAHILMRPVWVSIQNEFYHILN